MYIKFKLLLIIIVFPFFVSAQSCIDQKDPQTGKQIKSGSVILSDSSYSSLRFAFIKIDQVAQIGLTLIAKSITLDDANKMNLFVKYTNGQIRSFAASKNSRVVKLPDGGMGISFEALITSEDLLYFNTNLVTEMTLQYGDREEQRLVISILGQDASQLMNCLVCIKG